MVRKAGVLYLIYLCHQRFTDTEFVRGRGKAGEMKKTKYGRAVSCLLLRPRKYVVAIPSRGWEREGRQFGPVIYTAVENKGF